MPVALYCEPDAYLVQGRTMVGRRAAGSAFLRAAVQGRGAEPIIVYGGNKPGAEQIGMAVKGIDPAAATQWIPFHRAGLLAKVGTMFRPDPALARDARLRLRHGAAAYSLCGITHTLSSSRALEVIGGYPTEPLMPWDAVICTSAAAAGIVQAELDATFDYLRWRGIGTARPPLPQFPIIPLGVHSADFAVNDLTRRVARAALGLAEDEVVVLYAGRLSFSTKAHPLAMYAALSAVARCSGRRLVLVQAGQFFNDAAAEAFRLAVEQHCTGVRPLFVDGADADRYAAAFRAADLFMSLSDSIQETFGITPVEAMAAGLPVIVTDWNGYRDTVRDGIDGFRIDSWAPQAGMSEKIAARLEWDGEYEPYCARAAATVSVDMAQLVERLTALVENAALRRRMGEAGRRRARTDYDWAVVYRRYRQLWDELGARRRRAARDDAALLAAAPRAHPAFEDPYRIFAHYPSHAIVAATLVRAVPGASRAQCEALVAQPLFSHVQISFEDAGRLLVAAGDAATPLADLAATLGLDLPAAVTLAGQLAKMQLVTLGEPSAESDGR